MKDNLDDLRLSQDFDCSDCEEARQFTDEGTDHGWDDDEECDGLVGKCCWCEEREARYLCPGCGDATTCQECIDVYGRVCGACNHYLDKED